MIFQDPTMTAHDPKRVIPCLLAGLLTGLLLAGCGAGYPPAPVSGTAAAPQSETLRVGDITIRASAMRTSALGSEVASRYGIARDDRQVMLLVGVRQGSEALERSLPARVEVTVTDLRGQRQAMPMRELRSDDLVDYVGTVEVSLPDTLRFDLSIVLPDGKTSTMQFNREFYPQ